MRGRPLGVEDGGSGAFKSRTNVFDGTASKYRSLRWRNCPRNQDERPNSSSPATHACGNCRAVLVEHLQHQLMPRLEANRLRHSGLGPATLPLGPLLRQEEPEIDQGMIAPPNVAEVNADLAVLDLAEPAAPLPLHADRLRALLGERRRIEHQHAVGLAQLRGDLPRQLRHHRSMVPLRLADELLQSLALAVVQIGDRFGVLARQVREQPLNVMLRVRALLRGRHSAATNGCKNALQPRHHLGKSKSGCTCASASISSSRTRNRRSIDSSPLRGILPLKGAYTISTYGSASQRDSRNTDPPKILGKVWMCEGTKNQTEWDFALLLPKQCTNREFIVWQSLLPKNDWTKWISFDEQLKYLEIQPAVAVPDLT